MEIPLSIEIFPLPLSAETIRIVEKKHSTSRSCFITEELEPFIENALMYVYSVSFGITMFAMEYQFVYNKYNETVKK